MAKLLTSVEAQKEFSFKANSVLDRPETRKNGIKQDTVPIDSSFPVEEANRLATIESFNKHLFRPNTYLHKWWARRSGTTFRYILKQLISDAAHRNYYEPEGLKGKIILDPMVGGGTIAHEAIRLGASLIACDIDPIPVLQVKASLTPIPLEEKVTVFENFFNVIHGKMNDFFKSACPHCKAEGEIQFTLYGLRKSCDCQEAVFVDSLILRELPNGGSIKLCDKTGFPYESSLPKKRTAKMPIYEKSHRKCEDCKTLFKENTRVAFKDRYVPLVIVGHCLEHGQFFKKVDSEDLRRIKEASDFVQNKALFNEENFKVNAGPKSDDLLRRKVDYFLDLFSPRQLLYIAAAKEYLDSLEEKHRFWLGLLMSTSLEFNSLLCGYKGAEKRRPGAVRHVFSHHAYSFPHTALENNPVFSAETSGNLKLLFRTRIKSAAKWAVSPIERLPNGKGWKEVQIIGESDYGYQTKSVLEVSDKEKGFFVQQTDSSKLPIPSHFVDFVVTDPPYFDSVQYGDLSQFFRVWLKWFLPNDANWHYENGHSAVAELENDGEKYAKVLGNIWRECARVLKKGQGRLVFTFHHWRPNAWAYLTISLKRAGFKLVNTYTIHSENPISVHINNLKSLTHDSVLVLAQNGTSHNGNRKWASTDRPIDKSESYAFCTSCAELLGYCLENNLDDVEILKIWESSISR